MREPPSDHAVGSVGQGWAVRREARLRYAWQRGVAAWQRGSVAVGVPIGTRSRLAAPADRGAQPPRLSTAAGSSVATTDTLP